MPLETFSHLKDNTRLIQCEDTIYKLKVKYDIDSFQSKSIAILESEAHHEIEQVLRTVLFMIEHKQNLRPILATNILVHINLLPWGFLKKYETLLFTRNNKVLKVYDHMIVFLVKYNASGDPRPVLKDSTIASTSQERKQHNSGKEHQNSTEERDISIPRYVNHCKTDKRGKSDHDMETADVLTVYSTEKADTGQCVSRFFRDKSGRMRRLVQANVGNCQGSHTYTALPLADLDVSDAFSGSSEVKRHHYQVKKLSHSFSKKFKQQGIKNSHNKSKPNHSSTIKEHVNKTADETSGSESDNYSRSTQSFRSKSKRLSTKRNARQLKNQTGVETLTETGTDFGPVTKKLKLRSSSRLSGSQEKNRLRVHRRSERLRSSQDLMSMESEGETEANKTNNTTGTTNF